MPKLRVYQLARELNRDNAEIIRELQHMGVPVTSHSNTVEDRLADRLRKELGVYVPQEAKAEPKEETVEAAKVEAPPTPPATPATPPPPPPKVEQPAGIQLTPSGGRIIPPPTRVGPAVPPKIEPPHEERKTMQQ